MRHSHLRLIGGGAGGGVVEQRADAGQVAERARDVQGGLPAGVAAVHVECRPVLPLPPRVSVTQPHQQPNYVKHTFLERTPQAIDDIHDMGHKATKSNENVGIWHNCVHEISLCVRVCVCTHVYVLSTDSG